VARAAQPDGGSGAGHLGGWRRRGHPAFTSTGTRRLAPTAQVGRRRRHPQRHGERRCGDGQVGRPGQGV